MKRVSGQDFIKIVEARMARGMTYEQASSSLMLNEEKQRSFKEIMESDIARPFVPAAWEDENDEQPEASSILEWAEGVARETGKYEEIGWSSPPGDPADVVTAADLRSRIMAQVDRLVSKDDFALFLLATVDEVPYRRLAREFHMSKSAVGRTVDRVRAALTEGLHGLV
jgi:hypothetical protein